MAGRECTTVRLSAPEVFGDDSIARCRFTIWEHLAQLAIQPGAEDSFQHFASAVMSDVGSASGSIIDLKPAGLRVEDVKLLQANDLMSGHGGDEGFILEQTRRRCRELLVPGGEPGQWQVAFLGSIH